MPPTQSSAPLDTSQAGKDDFAHPLTPASMPATLDELVSSVCSDSTSSHSNTSPTHDGFSGGASLDPLLGPAASLGTKSPGLAGRDWSPFGNAPGRRLSQTPLSRPSPGGVLAARDPHHDEYHRMMLRHRAASIPNILQADQLAGAGSRGSPLGPDYTLSPAAASSLDPRYHVQAAAPSVFRTLTGPSPSQSPHHGQPVPDYSHHASPVAHPVSGLAGVGAAIRPYPHHRSLSLTVPSLSLNGPGDEQLVTTSQTPRIPSISHALSPTDDSATRDVYEKVISSIAKDYFDAEPDSPSLSPQAAQIQFERARSKSISQNMRPGASGHCTPQHLDTGVGLGYPTTPSLTSGSLASVSDMESMWNSPKPVSHSQAATSSMPDGLSPVLGGPHAGLPLTASESFQSAATSLGGYMVDTGGSLASTPTPALLPGRRYSVVPNVGLLGTGPMMGGPPSTPTMGPTGYFPAFGQTQHQPSPPPCAPITMYPHHMMSRRHSVAIPMPSASGGASSPVLTAQYMGAHTPSRPSPRRSPSHLAEDMVKQLNLSESTLGGGGHAVMRTSTIPAQLPHSAKASGGFSRAQADIGGGLTLNQLPPNCRLCTLLFKAGRSDIFYVPMESDLALHPGLMVVCEGDRGTDLGQVGEDNVQLTEIRHVERLVYQLNVQAVRKQTEQEIEKMRVHNARLFRVFRAVQFAFASVNNKEVLAKRVYRPAKQSELDALPIQRQDEVHALEVCRRKVADRALPMRVLNAEYQW
ncbi:hypothetical protein H4R34_001275 [Dimargaris verticillata]|uniref:PSP1 C-terminal domain-containing protein n=1 Tax=Dimargaris verticillata TaxID=2761393 RepID=A0A9W8BA73_9FUNG|nr:hypothetical protein H4R34_001275 [Dimargaris verticillata]